MYPYPYNAEFPDFPRKQSSQGSQAFSQTQPPTEVYPPHVCDPAIWYTPQPPTPGYPTHPPTLEHPSKLCTMVFPPEAPTPVYPYNLLAKKDWPQDLQNSIQGHYTNNAASHYVPNPVFSHQPPTPGYSTYQHPLVYPPIPPTPVYQTQPPIEVYHPQTTTWVNPQNPHNPNIVYSPHVYDPAIWCNKSMIPHVTPPGQTAEQQVPTPTSQFPGQTSKLPDQAQHIKIGGGFCSLCKRYISTILWRHCKNQHIDHQMIKVCIFMNHQLIIFKKTSFL